MELGHHKEHSKDTDASDAAEGTSKHSSMYGGIVNLQ